MQDQRFSYQLERWLQDGHPKTVDSLTKAFGEKSFAIVVMLLMLLPATPIPTGGITHVLEVVVLLLCLEMIAGRKNIWLPKRFKNYQLGSLTQKKAVPFILGRIRWFERLSRPRLSGVMRDGLFIRFAGLLLLILTLAAFFSVPFSGLDTLPSLGAVIISLSLLFDDLAMFLTGCIVGSIGLMLIAASGFALNALLRYFF